MSDESGTVFRPIARRMKSGGRRQGGRRPWYRFTTRRALAFIGGIGVALGVLMTAFRHSEWARLYEWKMLQNAANESRWSGGESQQLRQAQRTNEAARLIAR